MPPPHRPQALCFLLLGCPHCALAMSPCKEDEYPVGAECCPKCSPGYRVHKPCGKDTGTFCVPCPWGTYTAHLNGLSECLQCRVCDPGKNMAMLSREIPWSQHRCDRKDHGCPGPGPPRL
ncbi:LOW QUALITY PROTEIN: tumor necrosis factor receptor superfamily member 14-like [Pteropus vampyrus]|uniref:LOW QUALITY PROTEIN: tumor necrosis factor receptor superfamily member 14-like n=1 Tax=Pteropus vampyrus TaxID=132908 RepID=A0A6P3S6C0_PTEVA|nr:LOW QUALITY PROTEIN: tumor necrosis factor receptor superfamily member 14-like [Pteropus vampyrus]